MCRESEAEIGDTYINDRLHYEISVVQKAIVPDLDEKENGLWYWLHGEGAEYGAMPYHYVPKD